MKHMPRLLSAAAVKLKLKGHILFHKCVGQKQSMAIHAVKVGDFHSIVQNCMETGE